MKLRSGWMLLVAALPLVSTQTSCSDGEPSPQEISDAGTLQLRLTGQSEAGHTYRLRDAELEITGTSSVTLHSEDDPDAAALRHDLPVGGYEILLEDGWFLERQEDDGTFVPVEAVLMSANPAPFEIVAQETTNVRLRFQAGDEIVDLGDGALEVVIEIEEEDTCRVGLWRQIATLPTTPARPIRVDGIQAIDGYTLLVATQNEGSLCGGGTPGAIWRIDLGDYMGEATQVSFQQWLDLTQSMRGAFFESSDGTLLTGGGWCGFTPPYYSTDHGDSFQPATNGDYPTNSTFVYGELDGQVYAGTGYNPYPGSVYRYNGGGSWTHVFTYPRPHNIVQAMAVHQGQLFVGATIYEDSAPCSSTSPVYVSSDGVTFTPTEWPPCSSVNALADAGNRLFALGDAGHGRAMFKWASATESWSELAEYPFDDASAFQNLLVAGDGALFAGAVLKGASNGGIYRSEDGISWAPVVELEGLRLDTLNVEEDTILAAATPASGGVKIYALDIQDCFPRTGAPRQLHGSEPGD